MAQSYVGRPPTKCVHLPADIRYKRHLPRAALNFRFYDFNEHRLSQCMSLLIFFTKEVSFGEAISAIPRSNTPVTCGGDRYDALYKAFQAFLHVFQPLDHVMSGMRLFEAQL
jgi:hypothetical protein